jgi:hypothetical protein
VILSRLRKGDIKKGSNADAYKKLIILFYEEGYCLDD